jgi:hypothetical protein
MSLRNDVLKLLDDLDEMMINLNHYFEDPGYVSMVNGIVAGRLRALSGYLRQLDMLDLLDATEKLDPEPQNIVHVLEDVRSYVLPELRRRLGQSKYLEPAIYDTPINELLGEIESQRDLMISVATGGPKIQSVNREYVERRGRITSALSERGIRDPNPFSDLWAWYGRWSSGELPSYQSRRDFVRDMYDPLVRELQAGPTLRVLEEATGWERVDRGVDQVRRQLRLSKTEEQFQAVGLYCRESLISLAQEVYNPQRHPPVDEVIPSSSDAKRMLEAFIAAELGGNTNKVARKHAKAALDLANELQHERTATFRNAALCAEATISVVNIIAIIAGMREGNGI